MRVPSPAGKVANGNRLRFVSQMRRAHGVFVRSRLARAVLLFEKTFSPLERPLFCLFYNSHDGSPHPQGACAARLACEPLPTAGEGSKQLAGSCSEYSFLVACYHATEMKSQTIERRLFKPRLRGGLALKQADTSPRKERSGRRRREGRRGGFWQGDRPTGHGSVWRPTRGCRRGRDSR